MGRVSGGFKLLVQEILSQFVGRTFETKNLNMHEQLFKSSLKALKGPNKPFQPVLGRIFDVESEFEVKNQQIRHPGAKNLEKLPPNNYF